MIFTVGSLFAGVGGICLGFQKAHTKNSSYKMVWANEIDQYAAETYRTNFEHTLIEGDISLILDPLLEDENISKLYQEMHSEIIAEPIDVLTGGFPCQTFSIAGEQKGFEDERGNLFLAFIDLVEQLEKKHKKKPRILFLENVKNLKSHDKGRTYRIIKEKLENAGYLVKEEIMNTKDFSNLPQNRERIYIIGFLNKEDADNFTFFDDLDKYKNTPTKDESENNIKRIINSQLDDEEFKYTREKYPRYFMEEEIEGKTLINLEKEIVEENQFYQLRRGMYVRKNQSNVCPTLTANMGTGGHNVPLILTPNGIRKITPEESFKLQGFPIGEGYELPTKFKNRPYANSHLYKQAGNAVSVPVIEMLAKNILKAMDKTDNKPKE